MVNASAGNRKRLFRYCGEYRVPLWECPQFLFMVMGLVIIVAILGTYFIAARYQEPEQAIPILSAMTAVLFIIGHFVVSAFERVARSSKSKSEFISIMSHQLRSPLSAIKWQIDSVLGSIREGEAVTDNMQKYLEAISDYNERMIRLVNDLLEVNRIEDDDVLIHPSNFSLIGLWKNIIKRNERYAKSSNVVLSLGAPDTLPDIYADEDRIRVVIQHLLDNAIRYSVQGGTVIVVLEVRKKFLHCSVTDQGVGILPEERPRVFSKFFRSSSVVKHQTEGSGVGLFIAKALIEQSGGSIGFSSTPNKGSLFWFTLPIASVPVEN